MIFANEFTRTAEPYAALIFTVGISMCFISSIASVITKDFGIFFIVVLIFCVSSQVIILFFFKFKPKGVILQEEHEMKFIDTN